MTDMSEEDKVVVAVRHHGKIRWFRSPRDLWVLDANKWRAEFIAHGYDVPEFNSDFRFGIVSVNAENAQKFLDCMKAYEVQADDLSLELAKRYASAKSWWDVADLFPIMFVDFDRHKVAAFYSDGAAMERYIPDGWKGEFIDFANDYPEEELPSSSKFWVKRGADLLAMLNKRGAEAS
jgi:hypothetical protein